MAWGRLHDRANGNGKLLALSDAGWRMWGCGLIYCQDNLTDGFIPTDAIFTFGVKARNKVAVADELCRSLVPGKGPLWEKVEGGYQVHDYLDWNDPREKILADRAKTRERVERFRNKGSNRIETPLLTGDPLPLPLPLPQENSSNSPSAGKPHPVRDFLALHDQLFTARFSQKPAKYTDGDAAIVKALLQHHGAEVATQLLKRFMASQEPFILRAGFGLNIFKSQINKLLAEQAPTRPPAPQPNAAVDRRMADLLAPPPVRATR